tara:strand:- start:129 stop:572 length:444 start_codon:yes stop_codon:yes gene_type:complete
MKIENIETWLVSKWLTVRVTCDDGTYGVGEGNFWSYADATEVIAHRIKSDIQGLDPRDIDRIWNTAYRKYSFRSPAITAVLSAIDMALWDIKGKRLGVPVWDLLGGKVAIESAESFCLVLMVRSGLFLAQRVMLKQPGGRKTMVIRR